MKQYVTLPHRSGGAWATGPSHGCSVVVEADTYQLSDSDDPRVVELTGVGWVALAIPGSDDIVVVSKDDVA